VTLHSYKHHFVFCLLAIMALQPCCGQEDAPTPRHSIQPTTDFDQRFYYVNSERQNVWGYRMGVLINEKYKLGIGGYYMNRKADMEVTASPLSRTTATTITFHKELYLGTVYYEPYLLRKRLWEASIVFETGYGRTVNYTDNKSDHAPVDKNNAALVPAGAGLSFNFKPPVVLNLRCLRWIGINAMAGYRAAVYQQDKEYNYNGAYWSISGAIFLDKMVQDYRRWKRQRGKRQQQAELHF
jgi:hypothetical protein